MTTAHAALIFLNDAVRQERFAQTLNDFNAQDAADRAAQAKLDAYIIDDLLDDERELLAELLAELPDDEREVMNDGPVFALSRAGLAEVTEGDEEDIFVTIELTPRGERIARKLAA